MPLHDGLAGANQRFSIAERMDQDRGKVMYVQCISIFQSPCFGGNLPLSHLQETGSIWRRQGRHFPRYDPPRRLFRWGFPTWPVAAK